MSLTLWAHRIRRALIHRDKTSFLTIQFKTRSFPSATPSSSLLHAPPLKKRKKIISQWSMRFHLFDAQFMTTTVVNTFQVFNMPRGCNAFRHPTWSNNCIRDEGCKAITSRCNKSLRTFKIPQGLRVACRICLKCSPLSRCIRQSPSKDLSRTL